MLVVVRVGVVCDLLGMLRRGGKMFDLGKGKVGRG